jgi:hypothetical protein
MSTEVEREDQKAKDERAHERIPFDAMVEMGGSLGPTFEAQAVDVSRDGMHLKTAYLPDVGQPLTCRFDAGTAGSVLASGEVVWKQEEQKGGEFGVRFTQLDQGSVRTLEKIVSLGGRVTRAPEGGPRVRLHIDGLASPMRARVRGSSREEVTVGSELGFLQVGKELELEDAESGGKRAARIDRVEVEIDPQSRIPRLVVALRYEDLSEPVDTSALEGDETKSGDATPEPTVHAADGQDGLDGEGDEPGENDEATGAAASGKPMATPPSAKEALGGPSKLKGALAKGAAGVAPALSALTRRAKTALALLAAKRAAAKEPPRRTTAPPPGGGLHATGKKVVRGETTPEVPGLRRLTLDKRHVALGGAAALAIAAVAFAMHKPSAPPPEAPAAAAAPPPPVPVDTALANAGLQQPTVPAPSAAPPPMVAPIPDDPPPAPPAPQKKTATTKVTPFGNGNVTHGNVLRLKMDGPIEKIHGALQPTGFLVTIPGRKSLEPAAPLAARDGRIASIKVANDAGGAELDVAFRDGVPQFQVRAKGDTLELVLAPPGKAVDPKAAPKPAAPVAKKEPRKTTHHKR